MKCKNCGREMSESENPLMCDKCRDRMEDFRGEEQVESEDASMDKKHK